MTDFRDLDLLPKIGIICFASVKLPQLEEKRTLQNFEMHNAVDLDSQVYGRKVVYMHGLVSIFLLSIAFTIFIIIFLSISFHEKMKDSDPQSETPLHCLLCVFFRIYSTSLIRVSIQTLLKCQPKVFSLYFVEVVVALPIDACYILCTFNGCLSSRSLPLIRYNSYIRLHKYKKW